MKYYRIGGIWRYVHFLCTKI